MRKRVLVTLTLIALILIVFVTAVVLAKGYHPVRWVKAEIQSIMAPPVVVIDARGSIDLARIDNEIERKKLELANLSAKPHPAPPTVKIVQVIVPKKKLARTCACPPKPTMIDLTVYHRK